MHLVDDDVADSGQQRVQLQAPEQNPSGAVVDRGVRSGRPRVQSYVIAYGLADPFPTLFGHPLRPVTVAADTLAKSLSAVTQIATNAARQPCAESTPGKLTLRMLVQNVHVANLIGTRGGVISQVEAATLATVSFCKAEDMPPTHLGLGRTVLFWHHSGQGFLDFNKF